MAKNAKSVAKNVVKSEVKKTSVKKISPTREAYNVLTTELKKLTVEKKTRKSELLKKIDALWTEYKQYSKNEYKTARKAAIDKFTAIKTEIAKNRAAKKAEAAAVRVEKAVKKEAKPKIQKKALAKKVVTEAVKPETEVK